MAGTLSHDAMLLAAYEDVIEGRSRVTVEDYWRALKACGSEVSLGDLKQEAAQARGCDTSQVK